MKNILRFNWPWYACAGVVLAAAVVLIACVDCKWAIKVACAVTIFPALFWAIGSLAASYWIYDCSDVKDCRWLARFPKLSPAAAANVHAGFDETSSQLRNAFPGADLQVWDIFDPGTMTEGSILRARESKGCGSETVRVNPAHLPARDESFDAVFAIFAAHEQRSSAGRLALVKEFARILKPEGRVFIVEHLRDWRNFVAYGPGFFHFFSGREWLRVANAAELRLSIDFTVTPFVKVFCFKRNL
jgi:SAM-dependent methyltransferase